MKKASIPNSVTVTLIAGLVVLGIVFYGGSDLYAYAQGTYNDHTCKLSVKTFKETGSGLKCDRRRVIFYEDHVELKIGDKKAKDYAIKNIETGNKEAKAYHFKKLDENIIGEVIGQELHKCWNTYGEGDDIFQQEYVGVNRVCSICSTFEFDEDVKKYYYDFTKIEQYLKDNPVGEISYYDYINYPLNEKFFWFTSDNFQGQKTTFAYDSLNLLRHNKYSIYYRGLMYNLVQTKTKSANNLYMIHFDNLLYIQYNCDILVN